MVITKRIERKQQRLDFLYEVLEKQREAYLALLSGGVQSFTIGSRNLTMLDLPDLWGDMQKLEQEIDELESELSGCGNKRKLVGIVPRGW